MKDVFELQAEICKTLANPKRLEIIYLLKDGELSVGEMVERLKLPKANVSQHLAVMRQRGIVAARREGVNIYYSIANPKIVEACRLMREVMLEQIEEKRRVLEGIGK